MTMKFLFVILSFFFYLCLSFLVDYLYLIKYQGYLLVSWLYIWVIDQACSVKMAGYWPSSFFACLYKHAKNLGHLDRTSLVNKGFIIWDKTPKHDKFSLRDKACILSGHDRSYPEVLSRGTIPRCYPEVLSRGTIPGHFISDLYVSLVL